MATKTISFDEYLKSLPADQRPALEKLCRAIRSVAPDAVEGESYGMPAFLLNGKPLVAFSASAKHCSFFPMDGSTTAKFANQLKAFSISKGTIRFTPNQPLPTALVKKIVQSRIADLQSAMAKKKKPVMKKPNDDTEVTEFFNQMNHPLAKEYQTTRETILKVSPKITAGIKWNSVSFRTTEWFATINWRARDNVQLVFHLGAKVRDNSKAIKVADPAKLMKWLATDRCLVSLGTGTEFNNNLKPLAAIVKSWIKYV